MVILIIAVGADNITKVAVTNKSLDSITISWDQPDDPNGVIFTYTVEYQRVDTKYVSIKKYFPKKGNGQDSRES